MRKLMILFTLIPVLLHAQNTMTYSVSGVLHFPEYIKNGYGAGFSINKQWFPVFSVGIQTAVVKINDIKSVFIPILASFTISPLGNNGFVHPMILLQPGYGIHNVTENTSQAYRYSESGGFAYFFGLGVKFTGRSSVAPFIHAGYSGFTINRIVHEFRIMEEIVTKTKSLRGGFAVRAGIYF